ncbi:hypothetical protein D1815_02440 [Aquimarina sp. AD1]|uniref:hypothetical protein n=1 Tax=Aquimarina sp. (strain AD1) TaxID=1714848 RepID=UPI000E529C77|nr:hypothetical protein [Aquimarina sp. AD1]AXT54665.1 hypothetical protein D1815_02440 [Aquimarina sp. AD1]RKN04361.1 hypothetical protein D7035_21840 [Aquimarina sp. AD1]
MKSTKEIISEIESFKPVDGNWLGLDELVNKLWESGNPELGINALFGVFERYPNDDGAGVFWTILHGLETLNYEKFLYNSLMDKPSHMGINMLKRIENTDSKFLAGKSITELKEFIKNSPKADSELLSEL